MSSAVTSIPTRPAEGDVHELMQEMGRAAVSAAERLALASSAAKDRALSAAATAVRAQAGAILAANAEDLREAQAAGLGAAMLDRLQLDERRVEAMARGLEEIVALPDPVGAVIAAWTRPNGLRISRVRVPLGVIGIVYESRPNVTADAGALCLKSGNAAILRGGSESRRSSAAIHACLLRGLQAAGLPAAAIQLVPLSDRAAVGEMRGGMQAFIDVLVPGGGKSLVARVQAEARVPVIGHLEGNCHVYVDRDADLTMARHITLNAKMRRTGMRPSRRSMRASSRRARPTGPPSTSTRSLPYGWSRASTRPSRTLRAMARRTPTRSLPPMRPPRNAFSRASTALSCCTTPQLSSRTEASSAWARKSVSPPIVFTPAGRWASNSSRATSIACRARDRYFPDRAISRVGARRHNLHS